MIEIKDTVLGGHFASRIPENGYVTHHLTGSYYICEPPVIGTDLDILVLVNDMEEYKSLLLEEGWEGCTGYEDKEPHFFAARNRQFNLIVTDEVKWYTKFAAATELAKHLNLMDKKLRVELFELVLDEKKEEEPVTITSIIHPSWGTIKSKFGV